MKPGFGLAAGLCSAPVKTAADIMTREIVSIESQATMTDAAKQMAGRQVGAALVFEDEGLLGIVTERDVLRAVADGRVDTPVADCMTRHPETIEPADPTSHAATLMIHGGFRHLPVVEAGKVVGIISIRDLMRVVLDDTAPRGV